MTKIIPFCGYLILIFEKLQKFHSFSGVLKRAFDLFNIQSVDRNFIFFISSRIFTFVAEQYKKNSI